uniref:Centrosomal protein 43 n=1 Tax=Homo sapiens TaxID=9606 RepID=A0A994J4U5_HUMAN
MAATAAAVVAEEDTELRDLLVQTLENSGVLNRIKAELRAAVFLALEEQEKVENKTPLVNESLKKFLNTKDGRLVASLVAEFLQFFNLDFTLAVFQPETSTLQGLEGRENLARDLGIIEAEGTVGGPLLLEVIRRCQQKEKGPTTGEGALDLSDVHSPPKSPEGKTSAQTTPSKIPRYKGQGKKKTSGQKAGDKDASSITWKPFSLYISDLVSELPCEKSVLYPMWPIASLTYMEGQ